MGDSLYIKDDSCKLRVPKTYKVDFNKIDSIFQWQPLIQLLFESLNVVIQEDSIYYEQLKDVLEEV